MSNAMSLNTPQGANLPWYRHRWPWLLMLGPFIVIMGGLYLGYLAFSQPDALVVGDYYKKGKAINQDLRRDQAATALGAAVGLRYDAARGVLTGKLELPAGRQERSVQIHLAHATQPGKDVVLTVAPDADGVFGTPLALLERSRWQVLVEGEKRDWRLEGVWQWPAQHEIEIRADAPAPAR
ncbi:MULTISPECIES: FixH family protein [unclassified Massilia]|uniref:FixH family protein n=1 Tax=unclassified Massilia TaxID=2609279 RepID=UPI000A9DB291|nr:MULTISPECIES: FixH family protein [unclassified Massilia]